MPCADAVPASAVSSQYRARQQATATVPAGNALMLLRLGIERIRHRTADRFGLERFNPDGGHRHVRVMGRRRAYDAGTPLTGFPDMDAPLPPMFCPDFRNGT
ncbi:hypothetical protein LXE92_19830 [Burkholderia contaminans]|nr:hypothetical protein [Burkholderia contaminans]WFN13214.1 hypothetical protein LXE92_19830 [Burkholderia contaminans]